MYQPLSYIHPGAKIAKNVVVEPFTSIDKDVVIGEGTWIGSNVTIMSEFIHFYLTIKCKPLKDYYLLGVIMLMRLH